LSGLLPRKINVADVYLSQEDLPPLIKGSVRF